MKKSDLSLPEVNATIDTTQEKSGFKKFFAFLGPAYLVSVGYMDPGNWATDIAGGSQFGYTLIWVLLMSNIIAVLLQSFCARLGIVRGRDLAQASRETYSRPVNISLYILAEIAIAACDLAEVLGMAIGLQLLFGIPLMWGVTITVLDTFLLLFLINYGIRKMEAFILSMIAIIGFAFLAEMIFAKPDLHQVIRGFVPSIPNETALYIAIGIIGATVMPHNLYLHSSLVQTRKFNRAPDDIRKAIKYNVIDSVIALNLAFFVNAAILVLAAAAFFNKGLYDISEIQDAHKFLAPLLGTEWASKFFAIALIAAGQSSTITGTLAGQIVMEGYLNFRIAPWIRRLITRLLAIIPALLVIYYFGEAATGKLLILSQVILSLQLGFAIIPLIHFVSDKSKMKEFVINNYLKITAWIFTIIIVGLNARLIYSQVKEWVHTTDNPIFLLFFVLPLIAAAAVLLLYITFRPLFSKDQKTISRIPHGTFHPINDFEVKPYKRVAVAIDFSKLDRESISNALFQGGKKAEYLLMHVVESAGALIMKNEIRDYEFHSDQQFLHEYAEELSLLGYHVSTKIGYGNPTKAIPTMVKDFEADLLVMGAHGHKGFKDFIFGATVDSVRHRVSVPVLIVRSAKT
jgi:manganese transport protein